jgi:hypothetical protein
MNVRSAYAFIESGSIGHMHRLKADDNSEILKLNLLPGFTLVVSEMCAYAVTINATLLAFGGIPREKFCGYLFKT